MAAQHEKEATGKKLHSRSKIVTMEFHRESEFVPASRHAALTTGEVIRMLRELKGWTQAGLAERYGISATNNQPA